MAIGGCLLDIEGVLLQGDEALPGAPEAVRAIRERGLPLGYLTNTTTRPRSAIAARLDAAGIGASEDELRTPSAAAVALLGRDGIARVHLAADPALAADFEGFDLVDERPQAVVLGDLHSAFTWERLDGLFAMLRDGARLVALHRNRYCRRGGRLSLDLGPFVAALEYASATRATVVGKPSAAFFAAALEGLGAEAAETVMVGDDIEADIGGALEAGLRAVQVRTGKYTPADEAPGRPQPTGRIASIAELPGWLDAQG